VCRNELTARTINKYEGHNICDKCNDNIYKAKVSFIKYFINISNIKLANNFQNYGPPAGFESIEERSDM
jgi:hypothetical protein